MHNEEILEKNGEKKFDVVLMNPPYAQNIHVEFLDKIISLVNHIVSIQPIIFLFGKNQANNRMQHMNNIKNIINEYGAEIENIEGVEYFDAAPPQDLGIIFINKKIKQPITLINYTDKKEIFNSISEIKKYGNDQRLLKFDNIVKSLFLKDNFWIHAAYGPRAFGHLGKKENNKKIIWEPDKEGIIVPLTSVRGNRGGNENFYTAIPENLQPVKYKNYRNNKNSDTPWVYIICNDYSYGNNIINYLKTDFVRSCLYFYKDSTHLDLNTIPWFDFSDPIFSKSPREIDDYLFKKYKINDEIRKHIEEILPDYYGIRN